MQDLKGSILVVEDEESVRTSLAQVFACVGYETRSAANGLEALIEMRRQVPDILLSDLNMPVMSGFELLSIVRRRFPAVHVIAMSGAYCEDAIPSGVIADAFYQKGCGVADLLRVVGERPWPPREPRATPAPIWIQRNGHDRSGDEFVTIACPECFRTFPQPINRGPSLILDTNCVHCSTLILYAIVDPFSFTFPQRYVSGVRVAELEIGSSRRFN